MFLKHTPTGHLVEVMEMAALTNPFKEELLVQFQHGEELPEPETIAKQDLTFPSGEALPRCWLDSHYREDDVFRRQPNTRTH